jgi:SAM-dependent methyltransferase
MELQQAIELIRCDHLVQNKATTWADLGCGTGLFTRALAQFLQPGSTVYAVDSNKDAISKIGPLPGGVVLEKLPADFVRDALPFHNLAGILMANALHFVRDKPSFLQKAKKWLQPGGCFLLVEYDTDRANPWVPYPLPFEALRPLFTPLGFPGVEKLQERPSVYHRSPIYAAWIGSS